MRDLPKGYAGGAFRKSPKSGEFGSLVSNVPSVVFSRALILGCLGDKDHVFESLDHDASVGPIRMGYNRVDRVHCGLLHGDPRLKALRQKVGLPE